MGVRAEVRNTGWDALFIQIPNRTLDMGISGMTITAARNNTFLFSDPYFFSDLTIVIRTGGPMVGVIAAPADLEGRRIGVQRQTTGEAWIDDELVGTMGITPAEIRRTTLYTDAINLLTADEIDAVIIDKPVAEGYQGAGVVTIVYTIVTNEAFGIPMPRGELALKAVVDAALAHIRASGKYDELIAKWFVA
jgi:polar amino acid transport system substrate-binding protein